MAYAEFCGGSKGGVRALSCSKWAKGVALFSLTLIPKHLGFWTQQFGGITSFGCTEAFTTSFWMGAFSGPTAKRHRLWSNCPKFLEGIWEAGGSMSRDALRALPGGPLVRKYKDKNGVARCSGLKDKLKASQLLGAYLALGLLVQK